MGRITRENSTFVRIDGAIEDAKDGQSFIVDLTSRELPAAGDLDIAIKLGTAKKTHLSVQALSSQDSELSIIEGVTYVKNTGATATGINIDRGNSTTAGILVKTDSALVGGVTVLKVAVPADAVVNGLVDYSRIGLINSTTYLVKLTNLAAVSAVATSRIQWSEK